MKLEDCMSPKTRRQYTEEFKAEAVRLVRDTARPVAQSYRCSVPTAAGLNAT